LPHKLRARYLTAVSTLAARGPVIWAEWRDARRAVGRSGIRSQLVAGRRRSSMGGRGASLPRMARRGDLRSWCVAGDGCWMLGSPGDFVRRTWRRAAAVRPRALRTTLRRPPLGHTARGCPPCGGRNAQWGGRSRVGLLHGIAGKAARSPRIRVRRAPGCGGEAHVTWTFFGLGFRSPMDGAQHRGAGKGHAAVIVRSGGARAGTWVWSPRPVESPSV